MTPNLDNYLCDQSEFERVSKKKLAPSSLTEINSPKRKSKNKTRDFNILLASKRKHGRYRLVEELKDPNEKHLFIHTGLVEGGKVGKFRIEPYILLNSLVTYKTIKNKKAELKSVKEKFEETLGVKVFITESTVTFKPFIYTFINFNLNGKNYKLIYVDESFYEKDYSGNIVTNHKFIEGYKYALHADKLKSKYYKQYIRNIVEVLTR